LVTIDNQYHLSLASTLRKKQKTIVFRRKSVL
jgi:hypothetical protein